jgi:hypothetical protein
MKIPKKKLQSQTRLNRKKKQRLSASHSSASDLEENNSVNTTPSKTNSSNQPVQPLPFQTTILPKMLGFSSEFRGQGISVANNFTEAIGSKGWTSVLVNKPIYEGTYYCEFEIL